MESRTYYYARVSSKDQNLDRQIAAFKALGASERDIITDKESGKDLDRAGYQALKNAILRRGDTLVVKSLDRLSRNKTDIHNELRYFKENGIRVKVIDLPTTMMDLPEGQEWVFEMVNNILIEVLGTIAEQERTTIKQRQAEGIAAAKAKGKKLLLPVDSVVINAFPDPIDGPVDTVTVDADQIPADMEGVDIGPKSRELFAEAVKSAKTVVWNGPMGVFENPTQIGRAHV